jgi:hypothetical protein
MKSFEHLRSVIDEPVVNPDCRELGQAHLDPIALIRLLGPSLLASFLLLAGRGFEKVRESMSPPTWVPCMGG